MSRVVLVLVETVNDYLPLLESEGFELILAPTPLSRAEAIASHGARIDAVLTRGPLGLSGEEMAALPLLKIICVIGAGYEQVDLQAASNRGITVTNGAGANASSVADHAMALLLSLVRGIPQADAGIRRGEWNKLRLPSLAGKRMGILGLGAVGQAIAKRAANGFDMSVSYHNRQPRPDTPYTWCASLTELAGAVDFLIVATPGGSDTRHLVNGPVLDAAIWAENVPFTETRDYVKKVLSNTTAYAALISGQPQSLKARLGTVGPRPTNEPEPMKDLP